MSLASGTRWYRTLPTTLTQTLVAANSQLWVGEDPNSTYPYAGLTSIASFTAQQSEPVSFAGTYDPAANNGNGSDILVICGFTGPFGFASAVFTLTGTVAAGQVVTATMTNGGTTVTASYTALSTDDLSSIAQNLVTQINESAAVVKGTPFLQQAYVLTPNSSEATITFGALQSGVAGNSINVGISITGAGLSVSPASTDLAGGGASVAAPVKYDGTIISGLSSQIQQGFTNCVTWHDHVWFWGDKDNPNTLYAADIDQPEGFTFMLQNGGYEIGAGDGDPIIRACIPVGNILYVFKTNSIYAITGYDFQSGEYEFSVAPAIMGVGTPSAQSGVVLNNAIIFWSGRCFYRLQAGAFELEYIGRPIPITQGRLIKGNGALMRGVAGTFAAASFLNESYSQSDATIGSEVFSNVAFFACDVGNGVADTVLVYDDDASQFLGSYAWSVWTGWEVNEWLPFGLGPNSTTGAQDEQILCWLPPPASDGPTVCAYGTDPAADSGEAIPFLAQTGWLSMETGILDKELHMLYLDAEATSGTQFAYTITPSVTVPQNGQPTVYNPQQGAFGATGSIVGSEAYQTLVANINPYLKAKAFVFAFGESSATSNYELIELTLDYIEEATTP